MPPRMVYAGSRMGHHLIRFKGRFNWPVEPGDLKNKWEWTKLLRLNWTELKITKQKMTLWPTKRKEFRQSQQCYLPLYVICSIQCIIVMLCILFIRDFVGCHACHRYFRLLLISCCCLCCLVSLFWTTHLVSICEVLCTMVSEWSWGIVSSPSSGVMSEPNAPINHFHNIGGMDLLLYNMCMCIC